MRGLGSTGAERGVVRGTGPVMEAEPAEFVLTAGIAARHVHAPPCPTCGYEAAQARRVVSASACSVLLSLRDLASAGLSTTSKFQLKRWSSAILALLINESAWYRRDPQNHSEDAVQQHSRLAVA